MAIRELGFQIYSVFRILLGALKSHRKSYAVSLQKHMLWVHYYIMYIHVLEPLHSSLFVFVEVLRPSQPNGVMSSAVSLPNHTFTGQA